MASTPSERTTQLLNLLGSGDSAVEAEILEAVYDELRSLAASSLRGWGDHHTLQPTALVHEAWLRLVDQEALRFEARSQFYRLASRVMRSVLVDHYRSKKAEKRGGGGATVSLGLVQLEVLEDRPALDVLAVEEALVRLEERDAELCRIVEMRFFGGLSHPEIGRAVGLPLRTVERRWRQARAWLQAELDG